jgi:serine/threonine-protein kinase
LTFLEHLKESRLLSEEQLAGVSTRFGARDPTPAVAGALVNEGLLTRYQAKQIWAGQGKGLVLGQYRILDELGRGGFGQVYKALHVMMDRVVAIKVISPELVQDGRARGWFRREVLASTPLCHPNIVMAYDANEVDDVLFLVMEYVDGPNLDTHVKTQGPLPPALAAEMMRQAALGLQHAHEKGMVHRDVKPANLLLPQGSAVATTSGETPPIVKVVDFGLARLHRSATAATLMPHHDKNFLGTPDYVSPEQARNVHAVDIRSDLYSLGCTFYFALTGRRPFPGSTVLEVVVQHREKGAEPLQVVRPEVPAGLRKIIHRLMAKDPGDRFQSPSDLVAALISLGIAGIPNTSTMGPIAEVKPMPPTAAGAAGSATALVPYLAFWDGPPVSRADPDGATAIPEPAIPGRGRPAVHVNRLTAPSATALLPLTAPMDQTENRGANETQPASPSPANGTAPALAQGVPVPVAPFRIDAALRRSWHQWVEVLETFVQGGNLKVNEEAYRALRANVLEHCRAQAGAGRPRPPALEKIEAVIEPWLSLRTLAATDPATLASVLLRCHELDAELGRRRRISIAWLLVAVAFLSGIGGVGWWLVRWQNWRAIVKPSVGWVQAFIAANPMLLLGIAGSVAVVVVIYVLSRLLRA